MLNQKIKGLDIPQDVNELIHELQLHQIELEMQNEELRKSQLKLQTSQNRYFELYNFAPTGYFTLDEKELVKDVNFAGADLLGLEKSNIINSAFIRFVAPDSRNKFSKHSKLVRDNGANQKFELNLLKDGKPVRVILEINSGNYKGGGFKSLLITAVDITERKEAEIALMKSEKNYRNIFENTGTATVILDENLSITQVNSEFERLSGLSMEKIKGKHWTEFVVEEEEVNLLKKDYKLQITDPKAINLEFETKGKQRNGKIIDLFVKITRIPDTEKSLVTLLDITQSKKAENKLKESEQRLYDIIDFLPDPTFTIDNNGIVISWNKAIENMTGFEELEEMIGKGNNEYSKPFYGIRRPILIDLVTHSNEDIEKHYDFAERVGEAILAETKASLKGINRILWGKAVSLYDAKGNINGAIEVIRDLTESKEMEDALRQSEEKYRTLFEEDPDYTIL